MLQNIHDKAKGWVAYVIVFLISIPFALFGINSYIGGGGSRIVAEVNGEEIQSSELNNELVQLKQQFGQVPGFDESSLKDLAMDRIISRTLFKQEIENQGYRASSQEVVERIHQVPDFQKDGKFDVAQYRQILEANRRNEGNFERQVRDELSQDQFRGLVNATAFIPKAEANRYQALRDQKRDIETFSINLADYKAQVQITDQQISDYYEKNKARYMTPEQIKVEYVELNQADFEKSLQPSDEELKEYYDANQDRYVVPEVRNASHIVIEITSPEKEAEAKSKIEALAKEINDGTRSFEDIAKAESADTLSANKGGDLGKIVSNDWDKSFNDAVFTLQLNEVSAPVKTPAGYELIKLTKLEPQIQKTFDEAKSDVDKDFRNEQALDMFQNKDDELPTLAYENQSNLAPVADALHVKLQTSDWFGTANGTGIANNPLIRQQAFSEKVKSGQASDKIDLAEGHSVVIRVVDQQAASQRPLADVKASILTSLTEQEARTQVNKKGEELLTKLQSTQSWSALTELALGSEETVNKAGAIMRKGSKVDPLLVDTAFAMPKPDAGKIGYNNVISPNGDYHVIALKSVQTTEAQADETNQMGFSMYLSGREQGALMQALRESAEVTLYPENF